VGKRLIDAAPRELTIGNIVRRVLGLIRDEEDETRGGEGPEFSNGGSEAGSEPRTSTTEPPPSTSSLHEFAATGEQGASPSPQKPAHRPPLLTSHAVAPALSRPVTSVFSIISHPTMRLSGVDSPSQRSGTSTPQAAVSATFTDLRAEILNGISEIIDELGEADDQIANYALEHVHPHETIFTYATSLTVQRFLLKAASKRKFTVIHAESYPNNHLKTHALLTGNPEYGEDEDMPVESFQKPLASAGITVIMIPDAAIFALMSRASKVILGAHAVLTNGSFLAAAGSKPVVKAARFHRIPVIVLAATYKLSPQYPYDPQDLIEYGDVGKVIPFQDAEMRKGLAGGVRNPIYDFVESDDVDLYVTNLGGVSTGYLYRVVRDQYRDEDIEL